MSSQAINTVRCNRVIKGSIKRLLLAIAFHADDSLENATPSVLQLARDMGVTETCVHKMINRAKAAGVLSVDVGRGFHTPRGNTNRYTILLPEEAESLGVNSVAQVNNAEPLTVCLLSSHTTITEALEDNKQTDKGATKFTPQQSLPLDDEPADVQSLITDLAEYDVTGSHVTGWARLIVQRSNWQAEVANILAYWEANDNLGEGWIAARLKQLAYLSHNTPYRSLRVVKGRDAPEDEFEAIRRAYGGYLQAQSGGEYANVS